MNQKLWVSLLLIVVFMISSILSLNPSVQELLRCQQICISKINDVDQYLACFELNCPTYNNPIN